MVIKNMRFYCFFGLLILLCSIDLSFNQLKTESTDSYWTKFDDGEDEYDDYSDEQKPELDTSTFQDIYMTTSQNIPDLKFNSKKNQSSNRNCPENCDCDAELMRANCTNREFELIPKKLPLTLQVLDLSNNSIKQITKNDVNYLVNLQKIYLSHNEIEKLDINVFKENKHIDTLNFTNNKLSKIDPNAFTGIKSLRILDLSNNAIIFPIKNSFLNAPFLKTLILKNCSLKEIYDNTFRNTSGLINLMLDKNIFNNKINTKAFNNTMKGLLKLTLPDLEHNNILELCQVLQSIDIITFENYDLSCFELASGLSFDESLKPSTNKAKPNISGVTTENSDKNMDEKSPKLSEDDNATLSMGSEIVNYILLGIMGFAISGLIVGIICRKDIYGIKTKFCRTKKLRPINERIEVTEEILLNKVPNVGV